MAWCLCGDFNVVRREDERKGIRRNSSQKKEIIDFNNFIETNSLVELPRIGKHFTWYKLDRTAKSRLDKILASEEWLQIWPSCKQYIQPRVVSDHYALVVKSLVIDWGPKPFTTIDAWMMEPAFKNFVKEKWRCYKVQGNSLSIFKDKLKLLRPERLEYKCFWVSRF